MKTKIPGSNEWKECLTEARLRQEGKPMKNIDYLREELRKLQSLLEQPELGLMSWWTLYYDRVNAIRHCFSNDLMEERKNG